MQASFYCERLFCVQRIKESETAELSYAREKKVAGTRFLSNCIDRCIFLGGDNKRFNEFNLMNISSPVEEKC